MAAPAWAIQFLVGVVIVLVAVALIAFLIGTVARGPQGFFDEVGRTVARVLPQPQADIRSDGELKAMIAAMPDKKIRVGAIVADQDRVVFTVTAQRGAVRAAVTEGDELRVGKDGNVEVVPTGIPGLMEKFQQAIDDLRTRFFGR